MARRKQFDIDTVVALKPKAGRYTVTDPHQPGLYVRVTPRGVKSFVVIAIGPGGKQVFDTIGTVEEFKTIEVARAKARDVIGKIKRGEGREGPQSFEAVANEWFKRHVLAADRKLRSEKDIRRILDTRILPEWKDRNFTDIDRGDVTKLLDKLEDKYGPVSADKALAHISKLCAWYATRNAKYANPIVRGMQRSKPAERARERILSDDEIRNLWDAVNGGTFGGLVKLLLLTGQRRDKVASIKWADVSVDGTWTIAAEAREKGNAQQLVLPEIAHDIIRSQPRIDGNPYVFAGRGDSHFSGYSKAKKAVGGDWRLHDLRRTARSLLSRAGVRPDISERVLGHAIGGVEGIYDRHGYRDEKAHALKALAGLIEQILRGPSDNVVQIRA